MADRASSSHPAVQAQLDRLALLSPGRDILGLERITELLARLGDPHQALPPVLHVAGTNGKGSTCAFLRAAIEAAGLTAHVYTSPHLVRFNERIRLAGSLIDDDALAALLAETLDAADGMEISFFEATTAAAFLAFSRTPAEACIVEVGLGGRLDATNVIEAPLACGIADLGHDHHSFLGDTLERIAAEKAGIAKPGVPLVTQTYSEPIAAVIEPAAAEAGAPWHPIGDEDRPVWRIVDSVSQRALGGAHQRRNAALAVEMLRRQQRLDLTDDALRAGLVQASWPARLQRLDPGPVRDLLPASAELWLDGGHNPAAAQAVADFFAAERRPLHLLLGLLANKDLEGVLAPFRGRAATLRAVPVPGHDHHPPESIAAAARALGLAAEPAATVEEALGRIRGPRPVVLVMGSLYLAGEILRANGQPPG
jgi:dihydrofolate synthase / folylpolyglutamate synthase